MIQKRKLDKDEGKTQNETLDKNELSRLNRAYDDQYHST